MSGKCLRSLTNFVCDGAPKKPRSACGAALMQEPLSERQKATFTRRDSSRPRESGELAADFQKLLPSLRANGIAIEIAQFVECFRNGFAGGGDHGCRVAMRPADRFLDDVVDHAEAQHVLRGD